MVPRRAVTLHPTDRAELLRRADHPGVPASAARRARIVLLAAEGFPHAAIAARVGVSRPTVRMWLARYEQAGLAGLADGRRPGRPAQVDHRLIITTTLHRPAGGRLAARWTCRSLAVHLGVSGATVARAWRRFGIVPLPYGGFRFDTVPKLEASSVHVVGLVTGTRGKVVVLRLDDPGDHAGTGPVAGPGSAVADPVALVRSCADRLPDAELHVVADPPGRVELRRAAGLRTWLAQHPRLHLYGIGRGVSWELLTEAWLTAAPRQHEGPAGPPR